MRRKFTENRKNDVLYLTFPLFEKAGVKHGFSTKLGGVSKGDCATMNLSFTRGDDPEAVQENHRLFADAVGYPVEHLVLSNQVHDTVVRRVDVSGSRFDWSGRSDYRRPGSCVDDFFCRLCSSVFL